MLPRRNTIAYAQYCTRARPICSSCARHRSGLALSVLLPRCFMVAATRASRVLSIMTIQKGAPSAATCQGLRMRSAGLHAEGDAMAYARWRAFDSYVRSGKEGGAGGVPGRAGRTAASG